jgi:hypothetical protein
VVERGTSDTTGIMPNNNPPHPGWGARGIGTVPHPPPFGISLPAVSPAPSGLDVPVSCLSWGVAPGCRKPGCCPSDLPAGLGAWHQGLRAIELQDRPAGTPAIPGARWPVPGTRCEMHRPHPNQQKHGRRRLHRFMLESWSLAPLPGCGRVSGGTVNRWCRSFLAQPPAMNL